MNTLDLSLQQALKLQQAAERWVVVTPSGATINNIPQASQDKAVREAARNTRHSYREVFNALLSGKLRIERSYS